VTASSPPLAYDALLLVSFGGPERPEEVLPFLENVARGKNIPRDRLLEVAQRYELFGGASPLNSELRALLAALITELNAHGPQLAVYWGNRNWHPLLADTLRQMADDGVRRALAFVTSAFGSYPGCRQYQEDIDRARAEVGADAPTVDKLRLFYNHPGLIEPMAERVAAALQEIPPERRAATELIFTAHSIPTAMAQNSPYEQQLRQACRLVCERIGWEEGREGKTDAGWQLVYQSRSGPPSQPWLQPDIRDYLCELANHRTGAQRMDVQDVVIVPIGFLCEHIEIVYDLDVEAAQLCEQLGLNMIRADVVGCHPRFVQMIRELVLERIEPGVTRLALGTLGDWPDQCPADCCREK
jgi:protoporphyrin/coproporphyrin ferrochelatase